MVHAADIASLQKSGKFKRAFEKTDRPADILLQYPSASQKERYVTYTYSADEMHLKLTVMVATGTSLLCRVTKTTFSPSTT